MSFLKNIFKKPKEKPEKKEKEKKKKTEPKKEEQVEKKKPAVSRSKKHAKVETFRILKEPHISEKATYLSDQDKYVFKVYPNANKTEIKKAVEALYGVKVKKVNIVKIPRKKKEFRGIEGSKPGYKKALVTLEKGEKIEIIPR